MTKNKYVSIKHYLKFWGWGGIYIIGIYHYLLLIKVFKYTCYDISLNSLKA